MKSLRMDKLAGIRKLAQNVDTSKKYKVTSDGVAWQEYNDNSGKPYPIDDSEPRRIVAGVWIYYNPKDINLSGSTKDDLLKKTLASYDGEKEAQEAVNTLTSIPASPNYSAIKDLLPTARGVAYQITDKSVEKEFKEKFLTEWYKKTPNLGYTQADWDYYGPKLAENIWREYQESDVSNNTTTTGGSSNGSTKSKSSGGTSGSNKTQLAAPKDTQLSDNWGTYTVKGPFEFDWVKSSDGSTGTVSSSYNGWEQSAATLNKLWAEKPKESAPAATGPTTDEAAPKKEEETAQPEEMKVDQALLNNVKAILSIGSQKALRPGSPSNEMQLIKNMVAAIMPMTGGSEPVAFDYLAKVLIRENLDQLSAKFAGDISRDLYNAKISDLRVNLAGIGKKGLYEAQVAAVLDAVVRLNRRLGTNMAAYFQGAKSQKKSSLVNPKIEKLATLRRLRVRSQMEAAIESSARFGRSRVS